MAGIWKKEVFKAITFSFDDAVVQDIYLIELLNRYNLKATFNINSGLLSRQDIIVRDNQNICHYKLGAHQIKDIYKGHEVAVHTLTHPMLPTLSDDEVVRQIEQDRINLEAIFGYDIRGMAYPGGGPYCFDDRVAGLIKDKTKIKYARTTTLTDSLEPQDDLLRFMPNAQFNQYERMYKLADELFSHNGNTPKILYIWGHSYENDYNSSYWQRLEDFFKYVSGRSDVYYGTNSEVLL